MLTVFTNPLGAAHLGNPDRDNPALTLDGPQKHLGCMQVAKSLAELTGPRSSQEPWKLVDGQGKELPRIGIRDTVRTASDPELGLVHSQQYIDELALAQQQARQLQEGGVVLPIVDFGLEAVVSPATDIAARSSVGACLDAADLLLADATKTAFAMVWPPGHHAEPQRAMGFCYYSNVAIMALYLRERGLRVAVIDVDHHFGNGTRAALRNQDGVMMVDCSYRSPYDADSGRYTDYDHGTGQQAGKEFPYTKDDDSIGSHAHALVVAPNIVAVDFAGRTDAHTIMRRFLAEAFPEIRAFKPDTILWSLGVDSAVGDPYGGLGNRPSSFYTMIRGMRMAFPTARHGGVMEGGYLPVNWLRCVNPALLALHDDPQDSKDRSSFFRRYKSHFQPQ